MPENIIEIEPGILAGADKNGAVVVARREPTKKFYQLFWSDANPSQDRSYGLKVRKILKDLE